MRITGEVITTPYSFVATTHSIWWNNLKPVFVDVEEKTGNIDPNDVDALMRMKVKDVNDEKAVELHDKATKFSIKTKKKRLGFI